MSAGLTYRMGRIFGRDGRAMILPVDHGLMLGRVPGLEDPGGLVHAAAELGCDGLLMSLGLLRATAGTFADRCAPARLLTIDTLLQGRFDAFLSALHHLMLPVLTLVYVVSGAIVKMVRTNTLRALQSDYILYARASGLPEAQVARYALRAALTPAITLVGIFYSVLLSAAVTIEVVFTMGGIGQYAVRSILAFDYPAIQGVVLVVAFVSLMIYLLLDIVHAYLDPRIRY